MTERPSGKTSVAIIGSGIAGLTAAHVLNASFDLTVFESSSWVGGHAHTVDVAGKDGVWSVDTGFIVFNRRTYPHYVRLIDSLGVPSQPAPMTFSVRCDRANLEYRGADLGGLFAQKRNLVRPSFYRLLFGALQFNRMAERMLENGDDEMTVAEFFDRYRFPAEFREHYFLPLGSAIWSCPQSAFESFPIRFIAEFYHHHGLLSINDRPQWRVIQGGSRRYVERLIQPFADRIRTSCPVESVQREAGSVRVTAGGKTADFDHVVFACHADQALELLGPGATRAEQEILSAFPYESNDVVLHTDTSVLPRRRRAWAAWNYFKPNAQDEKASLTYNMNILQSMKASETYCVTLNNTDRVDPGRIIERFNYWHPVFNSQRMSMQMRHRELLGPNRSYFCGAYWRNGFHEDGVVSGLAAARALIRRNDAIQLRNQKASRAG